MILKKNIPPNDAQRKPQTTITTLNFCTTSVGQYGLRCQIPVTTNKKGALLESWRMRLSENIVVN
jgi:hypothetical protein